MPLECDNKAIWEERYARGEAVNRYPYDRIVGFVMKHFGRSDRSVVRILDYGAGCGNNTLFLAREGFDYYAVDYSASAIGRIEDLFRANGMEPGQGRLRCGEFSRLPFEDGFFDLVLDRQAMDQNPGRDIPALTAEILRVLKPGGLYYGINFADRHPMLKHGTHLEGNDYTDFAKGPFKNGGLRHFFGVGDVMAYFRDFEIVDIQFCQVRSVLHAESGSDEVLVTAKKPVE